MYRGIIPVHGSGKQVLNKLLVSTVPDNWHILD